MEILEPQNPLITTLYKALEEIDPEFMSYEGLIVPGSWPGQDDKEFIQSAIPKIKAAKEGKPYLGLCLGLHAVAVMEGGELYELPQARKGIRPVKGWWGETYESHWHKFAVKGDFPGYEVYETGDIIEAMRFKDHPFFVAVQFHPEYESYKERPHPILKEFIEKCRK